MAYYSKEADVKRKLDDIAGVGAPTCANSPHN